MLSEFFSARILWFAVLQRDVTLSFLKSSLKISTFGRTLALLQIVRLVSPFTTPMETSVAITAFQMSVAIGFWLIPVLVLPYFQNLTLFLPGELSKTFFRKKR